MTSCSSETEVGRPSLQTSGSPGSEQNERGWPWEPSKAELSACAYWEEAVHCQPRSQPAAYLIYLSQSFLGKNGQLRRPAY